MHFPKKQYSPAQHTTLVTLGISFSFDTELDPADSASVSAPELDTANAADVFELQSIEAGGVDFFSTLAS
jgi:hypothetical protein